MARTNTTSLNGLNPNAPSFLTHTNKDTTMFNFMHPHHHLLPPLPPLPPPPSADPVTTQPPQVAVLDHAPPPPAPPSCFYYCVYQLNLNYLPPNMYCPYNNNDHPPPPPLQTVFYNPMMEEPHPLYVEKKKKKGHYHYHDQNVKKFSAPRFALNRRNRVEDVRESNCCHQDADFVSCNGKTSLMIRNIPNQLQRRDLLSILDKHCQTENANTVGLRSEYDIFYLPMDFGKRANLGYAFVNFTNVDAASRFAQAFDNYAWNLPNKKKICQIMSADIQGKEALRLHFKNSIFPCHTDDYLPIVLSPPRDGSNPSKIIIIGRRVNPRSSVCKKGTESLSSYKC